MDIEDPYYYRPYPESLEGFGPTSIAFPNLIGWWDATDQSTITTDTSGNVSVWADKSPSGFDFSQSVGANRPFYNSSGFGNEDVLNNKAFVHFSSANNTHLMTSPISATGLTILTVIRPESTLTTTAKILMDNAINLPHKAGGFTMIALDNFSLTSTVKNWTCAFNASPTFSIIGVNNVYKNGHDTMLSYAYEFGEQIVYINGQREMPENLSGTSRGGMIASTLPFYVGANVTASRSISGLVPEIIIYNKVLTGLEFARMHRYLDDKYKISAFDDL